MIASLDALTPETRAAARAWLDASVAVVDADLRQAVRDELTTALCEGLDATSGPHDLAELVARLGPVQGEAGEPDADPRVGRLFGIPYDWRPLTGQRLRESLWRPADPHILVPKAFGAGWDVNFAALAVKARLIEPDAEDEPFAATPHDAFVLAAGGPSLLAAAVVAHYVVRGRSLPARLPSHWDAAGRPDRWVSKGTAAASDLGVSLAAAALGVAAGGSSGAGASRAGRLAVAAAAGTGAAAIAVLRTDTRPRWWAGPGLALAIAGAAGGTLLGLALAGRDAERRRDLGRE